MVFYLGQLCRRIIAPAESLVPLPDDIDFETAASLMMQGLTASHFVFDSYAVRPGDAALVHAAAGGVGLLLTQMIKLLGGTVIGRVSSPDKVEISRAAGADEVIVSGIGDFAEEVLRLTGARASTSSMTARAWRRSVTRSPRSATTACWFAMGRS